MRFSDAAFTNEIQQLSHLGTEKPCLDFDWLQNGGRLASPLRPAG
jgi:hypothetical protein